MNLDKNALLFPPGNAILQFEHLVEKAILVTGGAPFFMGAEQEFSKLEVSGDTAVLYWPEWAGGYYAGDGNIERQSCSFPAELLLMSKPEIEVWSAEQKRIYDEHQRLQAEQQARLNAERKRRDDLAMLSRLKSIYGMETKN